MSQVHKLDGLVDDALTRLVRAHFELKGALCGENNKAMLLRALRALPSLLKELAEEVLHVDEAALTIQSAVPGGQELGKDQYAAKIQSHVRGHHDRKEQSVKTNSAVKIQSRVRGHQERKEQSVRTNSAVKIQSHVRGHQAREPGEPAILRFEMLKVKLEPKLLEEFEACLKGMKSKVPGLILCACGRASAPRGPLQRQHASHGFNYGIVMHFESMKALEEYAGVGHEGKEFRSLAHPSYRELDDLQRKLLDNTQPGPKQQCVIVPNAKGEVLRKRTPFHRTICMRPKPSIDRQSFESKCGSFLQEFSKQNPGQMAFAIGFANISRPMNLNYFCDISFASSEAMEKWMVAAELKDLVSFAEESKDFIDIHPFAFEDASL